MLLVKAGPIQRSILNLGLQNCALSRTEADEVTGTKLKQCGSMAAIRTLAVKQPDVKQKWKESIEPVQALLRSRFERLALKDEQFRTIDPVTDLEIDVLKRHLREKFPNLDLCKLQKVHTKKVKAYTDW